MKSMQYSDKTNISDVCFFFLMNKLSSLIVCEICHFQLNSASSASSSKGASAFQCSEFRTFTLGGFSSFNLTHIGLIFMTIFQ